MFSNILFLVLVMMTASFAPEANPLVGATTGLIWGLASYGGLLALLVLQRKLRRLAANIELVLFLIIYHFILGAQRLYALDSITLIATVAIALYFLGLFAHRPTKETILHLRLLIPFALPFFCLSLLLDLIPGDGENPVAVTVMVIASLLLLGLFLLFFPTVIQAIWGCRKLPEGPLKKRLETLCERLKFRYSAIKTWPVMRHTITAGVLGIIAKSRYVLFTEGLIRNFEPDEVEAVLAHEIGHARKKHLLFFPASLVGLFVLLGLWSAIAGSWPPLLYFIPYALIVILYYRFVFGYFSRLFERQADLYIFEAGISVDAMTRALDRLGTLAGNIHGEPSWHHYSIKERIALLKEAANSPSLIAKHNRKVSRALWIYGTLTLLLLIATVLYPTLI